MSMLRHYYEIVERLRSNLTNSFLRSLPALAEDQTPVASYRKRLKLKFLTQGHLLSVQSPEGVLPLFRCLVRQCLHAQGLVYGWCDHRLGLKSDVIRASLTRSPVSITGGSVK
jgi:hypothetical protein